MAAPAGIMGRQADKEDGRTETRALDGSRVSPHNLNCALALALLRITSQYQRRMSSWPWLSNWPRRIDALELAWRLSLGARDEFESILGRQISIPGDRAI